MTAGMFRQPEGPRCIYLLDDDPDICRLVGSTLREFGFETVECHTAAELRRLLLVRVPDLCIVDLGLPDADGMDVVRRILTVPISATKGEGAMKGQMIEAPVKILTVNRLIPLPKPVIKPVAKKPRPKRR